MDSKTEELDLLSGKFEVILDTYVPHFLDRLLGNTYVAGGVTDETYAHCLTALRSFRASIFRGADFESAKKRALMVGGFQ